MCTMDSCQTGRVAKTSQGAHSVLITFLPVRSDHQRILSWAHLCTPIFLKATTCQISRVSKEEQQDAKRIIDEVSQE